jgi:serine/threonine protein kinase
LEEIFNKMDRNRLRQALSQARLFPSGESSGKVREISSTSDTWKEFILGRLSSPGDLDQTLRLTSGLTESYVRSAMPVVRSAFEEARRAADRSDGKRFFSEIEKINRLAPTPSLSSPSDWASLIWLRSSSEKTRQRIAHLAHWKSINSSASSETPSVAAIQQKTSQSAALPTVLESPTEPLETSPIRQLVRHLESILGPSVPLDWGLDEIQGTFSLPPAKIKLPETASLENGVIGLHERLIGLLKRTKWEANEGFLQAAAEALDDLAGTGAAAKDLADKTRAIKIDCQKAIEDALSRLDPSLTAEADRVRQLAANPEAWTNFVDKAKDLVLRNHELTSEGFQRAVTIARELQELTVFFDRQEVSQLGELVSKAITNRDVATLSSLREAWLAKSRARQAATSYAIELGKQIRELIRENEDHIDDTYAAASLELIKAGKYQMAADLLSRYFAAMRNRADFADRSARLPGPRVAPISEPSLDPIPEALTKFWPRDLDYAPKPPKNERPQGPLDWRDWGPRLYVDALQKLSAGSLVRMIDYALDLLLIAKEAGTKYEGFALAGLTLLLQPRPEPGAVPVWGKRIAENCPTFDQASKLESFYSICEDSVLTGARVDEFFAERLLYPEVAAFGDLLLKGILHGHSDPNDLEDIALGIAKAARFGNAPLAQALLRSLVRSANVDASVQAKFEKRVQHIAMGGNRPQLDLAEIRWAEPALGELFDAVRNGKASRASTGSPNVSIPQSVKSSGGFSYEPEHAVLDIALLVTNPSRNGFPLLELTIPRTNNSWLLGDVSEHVGCLAPDDKVLVQLRLDLVSELRTASRIALECRIVFKDSSRATRHATASLELQLRESAKVKIDDYRGADSRPLILEGDALELSPSSVKNAIHKISTALRKDGCAALLYGRRRRGKTSVLRTLEQTLEIQQQYCVISDAIEHRPFEGFGAALRHLGEILDQVGGRLNMELPSMKDALPGEAEPWQTIQTWLEQVRRNVTKPVRILLLLDEFQKWLSQLSEKHRGNLLGVFRGLRNVPSSDRLSFSFVLCGLTNLKVFAKASIDFKNAVEYYELKELNKEESEALLRANRRIDFDRRALDRISHLSGGNPFLINLLGQDIVDVLRQATRSYCLLEDVNAVISNHLKSEDSKVWRYLEYLLRKDEEDHGPQIAEYATVVALANTVRRRSPIRECVSIPEIAAVVESQGLQCDRGALEIDLRSAPNAMVRQEGQRFTMPTGWLCEWLGQSEKLLPVSHRSTEDLVLNKYKIGSLLSSGGQADIFESFDTTKNNKQVVLKIYRPDSSQAGTGLFDREARILYSINHSGVVTLLDHDVDARRGDVLVLTPVPGRNLRELLDKRPSDTASLIGLKGNLPKQVDFLKQIAEALWACHERGVVHKDISPGNIMVRENFGRWQPVLIDFGLASHPSEDAAGLTSARFTPGYVPPEKYAGQPRRTSADIYCFGLIAYELLTGNPPFPRATEESITAQRELDFKPLIEAREDITERLAVLVESMLHVMPQDRPDALTVAKELEWALESKTWQGYISEGMYSWGKGNFGEAYESLSKGVFAQDADRTAKDFLDGLESLSDIAAKTGRLSTIAKPLVSRFCGSAVACGANFPVTLTNRLFTDLSTASVDKNGRYALACAIGALYDAVENHGAIVGLQDGLDMLLESINKPPFWDRREDLFLLFDHYALARMLEEARLGSWCLRCCQLARNKTADSVECQSWLQRAKRYGVHGSEEYLKESDALQPILSSIGANTLPPAADQEEPSKILGNDEQGHFDVEKMTSWNRRLQRLYPWVQGARRFRGDGTIAKYPTRLLNIQDLARHTKNLPEPMKGRIIPAVLDAGYSGSSADRAIRINIILPDGTTSAQRETAMRKLRENKRLFPEE